VHAAARERRDQGAEPHALCARGDRAQRDPWVGNRPHGRPVTDVIPQKHAVPAVRLGLFGQGDEDGGIRQFVKWGQVQPALDVAIGGCRHQITLPGSVPALLRGVRLCTCNIWLNLGEDV
jgi:hypothetical protein